MKYLWGVNYPEDLKKLSLDELEILAGEIREYVISVVTEIGGHLGGSLGAVELTIALHYAFEAPVDKLVWDVGHQAYVHKVLTGRRESLKNIRRKGGISGFLRRIESQYDVFGAGHAGTSISAALGFAAMRDLKGEDFKVVAIIGDGGLTSGMSYEALNNAGASERDMIVVLNDNSMSISPNVGAISSYLTKIITDPLYNKIKADIWKLTGKIPSVGQGVRALVSRIDEGLKNLLVPGMLFEELGFRYIGPIDGHNLEEVITTLGNIKELKRPILLHVVTQKGKGMNDVEGDPQRYHSVSPASPKKKGKSVPKYMDVFGETLVDIARKDDRVTAITAAMCDGTGLTSFCQRFPDRFFDVGIAEQHAVTFAAGLAAEGGRPVAAIYSTFLQRSFDQIIHDVALQSLPVVFALDRAGLVGEDGPTHHGAFDLSYMNLIPNMIVSAPKDGDELKDLLHTAICQTERPFALRYPRDSVKGEFEDRDPRILKIGSWEELEGGEDLAILAVGTMVQPALEVSEVLALEGYSVGVINCRFVKPMDHELLDSLIDRYNIVLTLEENVLKGGFGSEVARYVSDRHPGACRSYHLGLPDEFIEHAPRADLLEEVGLSVAGIRQAALGLLTSDQGTIAERFGDLV